MNPALPQRLYPSFHVKQRKPCSSCTKPHWAIACSKSRMKRSCKAQISGRSSRRPRSPIDCELETTRLVAENSAQPHHDWLLSTYSLKLKALHRFSSTATAVETAGTSGTCPRWVGDVSSFGSARLKIGHGWRQLFWSCFNSRPR